MLIRTEQCYKDDNYITPDARKKFDIRKFEKDEQKKFEWSNFFIFRITSQTVSLQLMLQMKLMSVKPWLIKIRKMV